MAFFDLPLDELKTYRPAREEPKDFDAFWKSTLDEARNYPLNAKFERVDFGLTAQETFDVTFNGFGVQPVKGWLILPTQRKSKLPCVVEFIGYGNGRSFPIDWLCGQAQAMLISLWTRAVKAVNGRRVIHPIFMPKAATRIIPEI